MKWKSFFGILCLITTLAFASNSRFKKVGFDDVDEEEGYPFVLHDDEEDSWRQEENESPLSGIYQIGEKSKDEIWEKVRPYFLPEDHPIKPILDKIFSRKGVLTNSESLKAAGFIQTKPSKLNRTIVTSHPDVKNYLLKLFTDDQEDICEWELWINRIEGARSVYQTIQELDLTHRFTVPRKWLYPLPAQSIEKNQKNFILIVEDVNLIDQEGNRERWKSQVSKKDLDAIHLILEKEGLSDSVYPFNLAYTIKGKLAFIDTEKHHKWPVLYHKLNPYLSDHNQTYWKQITKQ